MALDQYDMLWVAPGILGLIGVVLVVGGVFRLFKSPIGGVFRAGSGAALLGAGAAVGLLGLNIQTYNRLSYEQPVAEVTLRQTGPQAFVATVRQADLTAKEYEVLGEEWQLDARVLKWKPWANVLGLDASYRLERMSGRYHDVAAERSAPRSVHQLAENPGLDLWELAQTYGKTVPVVDTLYGSGTYMPMADGASYQVTMSQSGLVARPSNPTAQTAVANWK
jgi:hypothetical protein